MSWVKIPCLLYAMLGLQIAVTPPHPPPAPREQLASTSWEVILRQRSGPVAIKCLCWVAATLEIIVIAASYSADWFWSPKFISLLVRNGHANRIHVSPVFILGICLTVLGASLRYWCYRELGNLFTFEASIRDNHRLVQTGPYRLVRHPGYTGALITVMGVVCWNACPGSWLRECGALETGLGISVVILVLCMIVCIMGGLLFRMETEDEALRMHFGEDWVRWSRRVPYRLVPFLF